MVEIKNGGKPQADAGTDLADLTFETTDLGSARFGVTTSAIREMEPGTMHEFVGGFTYGTTAQAIDPMDSREQNAVPTQVRIGNFKFVTGGTNLDDMSGDLVDEGDSDLAIEAPYGSAGRMSTFQSRPIESDGGLDGERVGAPVGRIRL